MIDTVKVELYAGTWESALDLVINLKLSSHQYCVNLKTRELINIREGIRYKPGDCYSYLIQDNKEEK